MCLPVWLWFGSLPGADSGGALPSGLWRGGHCKRPLKDCSASGGGHRGAGDPGGCVGLRFAVFIVAVRPSGPPVDKSRHGGSPALLRLVKTVPFELPADSEKGASVGDPSSASAG